MSIIDDIYKRMNDDTEISKVVDGPSEIQKFFDGKTIFLTGATGFVGKVLVEKILRDCSDIKRLYVLIRPKKNVTPEEKLKKYFQHIIFNKLRSKNPNFEEKVSLIKGDLQEDRLGIADSDRQRITDEVDIIVHNGATVKFTETIKVALTINVLATKHMLDLATDCKHIKAFIYISTAYSHCYMKDIEEKFYPAPGDLKMVYDMMEADEAAKDGGLSEDALKMLLGPWPNIYCFTKSIAEDLVRQYGEKVNFPCGVHRPSIVSAIVREPIPGWIGNTNGPHLAFAGTGLGVIHASVYTDDPIDLVPADYCTNSIIAAIYDLPQRWKNEKHAVVYNYGSSTISPIRITELCRAMLKVAPSLGSKYQVWYPYHIFTKSLLLFWICHIFLHFIPALIADTALLVMGKRPRALSIWLFGTKHLSRMFYFINGNWRIHVPEMMKVYEKLEPKDRDLLNSTCMTSIQNLSVLITQLPQEFIC